jgi:signal transduction histidine kinase
VTLKLSGSSYSTITGPGVFEILPYLIIDNAIKYSPQNSTVEISFYETQTSTRVEFTSMGPQIEDDEAEKIFERGFRGRHGQRSAATGSGLGLHLAKRLVERFRGRISVDCSSNKYNVNGRVFCDVTFALEFPSRPAAMPK